MWKVLGAGLLLLAGSACASQPVGCKARLQAVNEQLVFAKAHNNAGQIAGLEQAARNIKAYCTDEGLLKEQKQRVSKLRGRSMSACLNCRRPECPANRARLPTSRASWNRLRPTCWRLSGSWVS